MVVRAGTLSSNLDDRGLHILAETGPILAVLKPRGLPVNARCHESDCVINRLAQLSGDHSSRWCSIKRFWLPVKTCGIVCCVKASELAAAHDAIRDIPFELWFDVVVHKTETTTSATASSFELSEGKLLPLLADDSCEALLCTVNELGRLAHVLVKIVVAATSTAASADVANALTDAFASVDCPIVGTLKGCRRLKRHNLLKNEKMLALSRVCLPGLDSTMLPLNNHFDRVLADEGAFIAREAMHQSQHMTVLIDLLTGPKVADYCQYAPELLQLGMARLSMTSQGARTALDTLGLLAPPDAAWRSHATDLLDGHLLEQWRTEPRERQRLQYGMHVSRLLSCCIRVQRDGYEPVEWIAQGTCIEEESTGTTESANISSHSNGVGPLRCTELLFDRSNHCELLALNAAHALCSAAAGNCVVDLLVTQQPCVSCTAAMCNFAALLPHVQLHVDFRDWEAMQRALNATLRSEGGVYRCAANVDWICNQWRAANIVEIKLYMSCAPRAHVFFR